jgi:chromosome segregation ATPase
VKKINQLFLASAMILTGAIFNSCQSPTQKQEAAQDNLKDAKQELNAADQKVATAEEWSQFKSESELKIAANETRIAELKVRMNKPGEIFDKMYENKINSLEQQNKDLKARLEAYEKSQSNWETFKREFNHDMDELGAALKDLAVDNKK